MCQLVKLQDLCRLNEYLKYFFSFERKGGGGTFKKKKRKKKKCLGTRKYYRPIK